MDEPKVIELNDEQRALIDASLNTAGYIGLPDGDVLLKAPQLKLVHLSDLPDGTAITARHRLHGAMPFFKNGRYASQYKNAAGDYKEAYLLDVLVDHELLPGKFQVWQGGPCPWPKYVEVEVLHRDGMIEIIQGGNGNTWNYERAGRKFMNDIIAHRCTGRLLDGAKLVP